jgi:hypothetical protein
MSHDEMQIVISTKEVQELIRTTSKNMKCSENDAVENILHLFLQFRNIVLPIQPEPIPLTILETVTLSPTKKSFNTLEIVLAVAFAIGGIAAVIYLILK